MPTDVDRAQRWLHGQVRELREWRDGFAERAPDDQLSEAQSGVEALAAAGVLTSAEAAGWVERLRAAAAGDEPRPVPPAAVRDAGAAFLADLLAAMPEGTDPPEELHHRFHGALVVLSAAGAVDAGMWDARLRARAGWPTEEEERRAELALNEGGTQRVVEAVLRGDAAFSGGRRLLFAVRFADAVAFTLERDALLDAPGGEWSWQEWQLTDDAGTDYWEAGASAGGHHEHVEFRPGPPAHARRLELTLDDARFVVAP